MTGGAALATPATTSATSNPSRNPLSVFTPLVVGNEGGFLQEETGCVGASGLERDELVGGVDHAPGHGGLGQDPPHDHPRPQPHPGDGPASRPYPEHLPRPVSEEGLERVVAVPRHQGDA